MQTEQTITLFGTVSNSATSRISKNGRKYTAFGVAIISDRNLLGFHYNVVAFGKQGHLAKARRTVGGRGGLAKPMVKRGVPNLSEAILATLPGL